MAISKPSKIGRFAAIRRYFGDKDASFFGKAFVFFAVLYVATPIDLVPEAFVPVLGWLDDIGVVSLALWHLGRVTTKYRALPGELDDDKWKALARDTVGTPVEDA